MVRHMFSVSVFFFSFFSHPILPDCVNERDRKVRLEGTVGACLQMRFTYLDLSFQRSLVFFFFLGGGNT